MMNTVRKKDMQTLNKLLLALTLSSLSAMSTFRGDVTLHDQNQLGDLSFLGTITLHNVKAESLYIQGSLTTTDVIISRGLRCQGHLFSKKLECNNIQAKGEIKVDQLMTQSLNMQGIITLDHTTVNGPSILEGTVDANNSSFQSITLRSKEATFINCKIGSIVIERDSSRIYPPVKNILHLRKNTHLEGAITFKGENAEVHIDDTVILKGEIKNAKIIHRDKE